MRQSTVLHKDRVCTGEVIPFSRNYMANPSAGIRHVAQIAGNHVYVQMEYRLPGCRRNVDTYVVTVRTMLLFDG